MPPAKTMIIEITEANIGLSMKKRLNIVSLDYMPED
jgi:hypothetical protein